MNDRANNSATDVANTISIMMKHGDHYSYYVDVKGLLKGEWGGYRESVMKGPNGETMYELYYTRTFKDDHSTLPFCHSKWIVVNESGFFYNKFSCKKYDAVEDIGSGYYRCEKNDRYGIINEQGQEILHTCYNQIWEISNQPVFIVRCETGWFMYNVNKQRQSEVYEEIEALDSNYIRFSDGKGYGLLNYNCDIVIQPKYEKRTMRFDERNQLQVEFKGLKFGIFVKDDLLYGRIPPTEYDLCFRVHFFNSIGTEFFITKKGEKYGILNFRFDCVTEPNLDDILLIKSYDRDGSYYIIGKQDNHYKLFNLDKRTCVIDRCSSMDYCLVSKYDSDLRNYKKGFNHIFIEYCQNGHLGYVTYNGEIIGYDEYDSVELFHGLFLVSKNNQYGLLTESGSVRIPCENDEIRYEWGKVYLTKDGQKTEETIRNLLSLPKGRSARLGYEPHHYSEYAGSYAQDEMGYSDDDIDTIFDGDPLAYWNID